MRPDHGGRCPGAVAERLNAAETIAICCHVNPDGDTIGSALALRLGLEALGKRVCVFCQDKVPDQLAFLPGADAVRPLDAPETEQMFDLLLPVDISDPARIGKMAGRPAFACLADHSRHTAQLDHHGTNPGYCEINSVDSEAPATGILVYEQLRALGVPLTAEIATCIYAAISTDTGNFAYSIHDGEIFAIMAALVEAGLPLAEAHRRLFDERSMAQQLLTARAMASLHYMDGGRLGIMCLTEQDFAETGALPEHADTIANIGLQATGARMSLFTRETPGGIKGSLRALMPYCVDGVAKHFGGGGHAQAAGCTVQGTLEAVTAQLADALLAALHEQESIVNHGN